MHTLLDKKHGLWSRSLGSVEFCQVKYGFLKAGFSELGEDGVCFFFFLTYLLSKPFCEKQLSELAKDPPSILEALPNILGD